MERRTLLLASLCFAFSLALSGQKAPVVYEKVYIQTDRDAYFSGEDLWFKAYLTEAFTNKLAVHSGTLYVELVSPGKDIVQRRVIRLDNGIGWGDFQLTDSLNSGIYQVRAYTNWMLNFGDAFVFKQNISIKNVAEKKANTLPRNFAKKADIQFFPEGGTLVENVHSSVGFKAVDACGNGCGAHGWVISLAGDTVGKFESSYLGMGNFSMHALSSQSYTAKGQFNDSTPFEVKLPEVQKNGYVLKITDIDTDNLHVIIKTNAETLTANPDAELRLEGSSRNALCITAMLKIKAAVNNYKISKKEFPEGIARFTIYDTQNRPSAERLFYISHGQNFHVLATTDKATYAPREKVKVHLKITNSNGEPQSAILSFAASDAALHLDTTLNKRNILSYLLLESEIVGKVEEPAAYFDTTRTSRFKDLDLLLQTQGWRDFVWKHLPDSASLLKHEAEIGINITGRLRKLFINRPIPNAYISMAMFGKGRPFLWIQQTDSSGKFIFKGLDFTGSYNIILSATNKKHNSQGWLFLDSLYNNIPPVINVPFKVELQPLAATAIKEPAEIRYNQLQKYKLNDTILLHEIRIKSAKATKDKADDGNFRIYGSPDFSMKLTNEDAGAPNIFFLLQGRVAGLQITGNYPDITFMMRGVTRTPLFLLDGMQIDLDMVSTLPLADIDKIEVLKGASTAIFGLNGGGGVISIFTKRGGGQTSKTVFHSLNQKVSGFYQARVFYKPIVVNAQTEGSKPSLNSTLFWAPNVVVNKSGKAEISFYNGDYPATIRATFQGMALTGAPVTAETTYKVK